MACSDPEREKQPMYTWLAYHILLCSDAEVMHLSAPPPRALPEDAPSPFCKILDFSLMLVTLSVVVNVAFRTDWEESEWVGGSSTFQVLGWASASLELSETGAQAGCSMAACRAVPRVARGPPTKPILQGRC